MRALHCTVHLQAEVLPLECCRWSSKELLQFCVLASACTYHSCTAAQRLSRQYAPATCLACCVHQQQQQHHHGQHGSAAQPAACPSAAALVHLPYPTAAPTSTHPPAPQARRTCSGWLLRMLRGSGAAQEPRPDLGTAASSPLASLNTLLASPRLLLLPSCGIVALCCCGGDGGWFRWVLEPADGLLAWAGLGRLVRPPPPDMVPGLAAVAVTLVVVSQSAVLH